MRDLAWALSAALMVWALAYCTVQESQGRKDHRLFEAKLCHESGGRWSYGFSGQYCEYQ